MIQRDGLKKQNVEVSPLIISNGMGTFLKIALILCLAIWKLDAQGPVLESLRETIYARWDFQKEFPLAKPFFSSVFQQAQSRQCQECEKLVTQIRGARPTPIENSPAPALPDLWASFTLGFAQEKIKEGGGGADFLSAGQMAKGNMGANYELARILIQANMTAHSRPFQKEVQRSMLEKGYLRVPELAKLELLYARQAMDKGSFGLARLHSEFAAKLDPFCPWVPLMHLEMEIRSHTPLEINLGQVWIYFLEALHLIRYYDTQSLFILNLLRGLRLGFGIFGAVVLWVLFGRYFTRIVHISAERLPNEVELWIRYLAFSLIPVSLIVGGLGYAVIALLLIALLWKYTSRHEKVFLKAILLGLFSIPFLFTCEQSLVRYLDDSEGINQYHQAYMRGYAASRIEKLDNLKPKDDKAKFYQMLAYSLTYKKQGNFVKAAEYAKAAKKIDPDNAMAILNQGNLSLQNFDFASAAKIYGQARRIAPNWAESWFNSSQAELYSNNSSAHKLFLDRAAEEDAVWVTQFLKDNDEFLSKNRSTRKVMDPMLKNAHAWQDGLNSLLEFEFFRVKLSMGVFSVQGIWLMVAVALTSLLLYLRFRQFHEHIEGRTLFDCKICGRVMCRTCRKGVHCQSCFKTVSGIQENRLKMEMVHRIHTKSSLLAIRIGSALNTLLPGAGYLYLGLGGMRFGWVLISSLMLGGLWQSGHLLMEYPTFVLGPIQWLLWIPVVLLYGLFNLKMRRSPMDITKVVTGSGPAAKVGLE